MAQRRRPHPPLHRLKRIADQRHLQRNYLLLLSLLHAPLHTPPPPPLRSLPEACCHSQVPHLISLLVSMAAIWAIQYKINSEAHSERLLEREREDGMLLVKCVEELMKKGVEFYLLKEVDALRRAKSLRVASRPVAAGKSSVRDFGTMVLFAVSCGFLGLTRFV